jgi:hypothetical protein
METLIHSTTGKSIVDKSKDIVGWGIDANADNNPTYPIKHYTGADHQRLNYQRAAQQTTPVEVLHSNERPGITRVFGTSLPPSGLSGRLRRYAFRFSEGSSAHWLTLLMADRINVVEGIVDDLKRGHVPNIFAERGWHAEWKYNRKGVIRKVAIGAAITTAVVAFVIFRNRKKALHT